MPLIQTREITAASRLDNVRYAIRDLACVADEVIRQGHKVLALNVGDPNIFGRLQSHARRKEWLRPLARRS